MKTAIVLLFIACSVEAGRGADCVDRLANQFKSPSAPFTVAKSVMSCGVEDPNTLLKYLLEPSTQTFGVVAIEGYYQAKSKIPLDTELFCTEKEGIPVDVVLVSLALLVRMGDKFPVQARSALEEIIEKLTPGELTSAKLVFDRHLPEGDLGTDAYRQIIQRMKDFQNR